MSSFSVRVRTVDEVKHHPNADRLSVLRIGGYECVSAKLEDGSHRYKEGDWVIYIPEGAVVPDWLLRQGFWNEKEDKGGLAGPDGNRVHPLKLRGIFSQGIIYPVEWLELPPGDDELQSTVYSVFRVPNEAWEDGFEPVPVELGQDVTELLGITKYEPPIPPELLGSVFNLFGVTHGYDFDSIQSQTDMFAPGEEVVVTEKIHGFNTQIGYVINLANGDNFLDGSLYLSSKGLAAQGLAFKAKLDESEEPNVYHKTFSEMLARDFGAKLRDIAYRYGSSMRLFVEFYGGQDLKYGRNKAEMGAALFDVYVGEKPHGRFLPFEEVQNIALELGIQSVPLLYKGPFDRETILALRDGKDTFTGQHIREGVVIKSADPEVQHELHGRKIAKWVSPDYSLRKGGTEYQ